MKKLISIIMTLTVILISATGCREKKEAIVRDSDGRLNITTTIFAPYDFVRQIAGDRVNLTMLLPPGSESHSFEPSPMDIVNIQNTGLFIYVGSESEGWVERLLKSMRTDNMTILSLTDIVDTLDKEIVEGMEDHDDDHDREHKGFFARIGAFFEHLFDKDDHDDHDETAFDEHVWTSPKNAIAIVRAITDQLCELDADNAGYYRQNAAAYIEPLQELDAALEETIAGARRRTIIFGDRFPFRYLAHDYGLQYFAAFPGCSTETEPSTVTVAFLIGKIRAEQIPVVFHIELSNERMADTISRETGAKKLLLHSAHNITRRDFEADLTYLDLMRSNIENLREALY